MNSKLETFTKKIAGAESGEDVRDAIIGATRFLSKNTSNSATLNGIPASNFAKRSDYLKLIEELGDKLHYDELEDIEADDTYALTSTGVMTSGNLYNIIPKYFRESLKQIMHYENDPETSKTAKEAVESYLESFEKGKEALFDAVTAKGQSRKDATCFRDLIRLINNIGEENPVLITDSFDKEGTYDAKKDDEGHKQAYKKVTVNVQDVFVDETFNENRLYKAPEGKLYKTAKVSVTTKTSSASSSLGSGRTTGKKDKQVDQEKNTVEGKEITENGDYDANADGVAGWSSLSVHVKPPEINEGATFTVKFYKDRDSSEPLDTVSVPPYGIARTEVVPEAPSEDLVFAYWDPPPLRVIEDMDVYANFKERSSAIGGEITDDWGTIIESQGNYDVGSFKTYEIGTVNYNGVTYNLGNIVFQIVAKSEDGSMSTWVSKTVTNFSHSLGSNWARSSLRRFLNKDFLDILLQTQYGDLLLKYIVPVRKRSMCVWSNEDNLSHDVIELETTDMIWVPSCSEMFGEIPDDVFESALQNYYNWKLPDGTYIQNVSATQTHPTSYNIQLSWNPPYYPEDGMFHRMESKYTNYTKIVPEEQQKGYYDGVTYEHVYSDSDGHPRITITPNVEGCYIKTLSTTGTASAYGLRTQGYDYGVPQGSTTPIWYRYGVSNTGNIIQGGSDQIVPIGFCL